MKRASFLSGYRPRLLTHGPSGETYQPMAGTWGFHSGNASAPNDVCENISKPSYYNVTGSLQPFPEKWADAPKGREERERKGHHYVCSRICTGQLWRSGWVSGTFPIWVCTYFFLTQKQCVQWKLRSEVQRWMESTVKAAREGHTWSRKGLSGEVGGWVGRGGSRWILDSGWAGSSGMLSEPLWQGSNSLDISQDCCKIKWSNACHAVGNAWIPAARVTSANSTEDSTRLGGQRHGRGQSRPVPRIHILQSK
jgi:hypothetical protein